MPSLEALDCESVKRTDGEEACVMEAPLIWKNTCLDNDMRLKITCPYSKETATHGH